MRNLGHGVRKLSADVSTGSGDLGSLRDVMVDKGWFWCDLVFFLSDVFRSKWQGLGISLFKLGILACPIHGLVYPIKEIYLGR